MPNPRYIAPAPLKSDRKESRVPQTLTIKLERDKDFFAVSVPALNCHTQGKDIRTALVRLIDALGVCGVDVDA